MSRTVGALTEEHGILRLPEAISLPPGQRALVTILDDEVDPQAADLALLSEPTLSDWNRPEEDEAWADFRADHRAEP
jgi:hypothetical protein